MNELNGLACGANVVSATSVRCSKNRKISSMSNFIIDLKCIKELANTIAFEVNIGFR